MGFFPDSVIPQSEVRTQPCNQSLPLDTAPRPLCSWWHEGSFLGKAMVNGSTGNVLKINQVVLHQPPSCPSSHCCTSGHCACRICLHQRTLPLLGEWCLPVQTGTDTTCCGLGHDVWCSEPREGCRDGHSTVEEQKRGRLPTRYPTLTSHPPRKRRPVEAAYADKGFFAAEVILPPLYKDIN